MLTSLSKLQIKNYMKLKRWCKAHGAEANHLDNCFGLPALQKLLPKLGFPEPGAAPEPPTASQIDTNIGSSAGAFTTPSTDDTMPSKPQTAADGSSTAVATNAGIKEGNLASRPSRGFDANAVQAARAAAFDTSAYTDDKGGGGPRRGRRRAGAAVASGRFHRTTATDPASGSEPEVEAPSLRSDEKPKPLKSLTPVERGETPAGNSGEVMMEEESEDSDVSSRANTAAGGVEEQSGERMSLRDATDVEKLKKKLTKVQDTLKEERMRAEVSNKDFGT